MKKNLLLLLFAVLCSAATSMAAVTATIDVDNAANVVVTNGMNGTVVDLIDGMNRVTLDETAQPLVIKAADGATIESVKMNGEEKSEGYNGYTLGIEQGMYVQITTSGGGVAVDKTYNVWFSVDPVGSISVSHGDNKVIVDEAKYFELPANTDLVIAPENGFKILSVNYQADYFSENTAVDNGNGTWTVNITADYGFVTVTVAEEGIEFTVDVNLSSNVEIVANLDNDATQTKAIQLRGMNPYSGVAPLDTKSLQFNPAEGGEIKSITRIDASGNENAINYSPYVQWRSTIAQGDRFVIDAVGPEVDVTFVLDRSKVTLDNMIITCNDEHLNVTAANPIAKVHVGDIVTVTGGKGARLTSIFTTCGQTITGQGDTQSFQVTKAGEAYLYADAVTSCTINIDNAAAVTVTQQNGYGEVLALNDGSNTFDAVNNPLSVAAASGYAIVSVVLDGVAQTAKADGTYTVALEEGSTVNITTKALPKAVPVTFAIVGDHSKVKVENEGEAVELTGETTLIPVIPGSRITVKALSGYLIDSLTAGDGNSVVLDEETGIYAIVVNNPCTISIVVKEWVAAEGNALVTFNCDSPKVSGIVYDENGEQTGVLDRGLNEVKKGSKITVRIFGELYLKTVTVNGTALELAADAKTADINVDGELTIDVETYALCTVTGYSSSNPVNHSFIGYIYINEPGQTKAMVAVGETVTIIPTAMPGYKFDGFSFVYPSDFTVPEKEPYTFTIPEGVSELIFQGNFVEDTENPSYLVRGNNTYGSLDGSDELTVIAITRIYNENDPNAPLSEKLATAGETVHLLCYITQQAADLGYACKNFTLFNDQTRVIAQEYVVNPDDVAYQGVIEVAAIVEIPDGVESVAVDGKLAYDRASATLTAPAKVALYSISGNLVLTAEAGEVSLAHLPSGIYIATTGNHTLKIVK